MTLRLPGPPSRLFLEVFDSTAYFELQSFVTQNNECVGAAGRQTQEANVE